MRRRLFVCRERLEPVGEDHDNICRARKLSEERCRVQSAPVEGDTSFVVAIPGEEEPWLALARTMREGRCPAQLIARQSLDLDDICAGVGQQLPQ